MSGNRCRASRVLLADRLLADLLGPRTTPISNLPAFGLGDQLGRALGQLLHGAVERGPVGGGDNFAGAPSSRGTSSCARSAWAAPSRIGPEFIIDRAA